MPQDRPDRKQESMMRIAEVEYELTKMCMRHQRTGLTLEEWMTALLRHASDFQNSYRLGVEPGKSEKED